MGIMSFPPLKTASLFEAQLVKNLLVGESRGPSLIGVLRLLIVMASLVVEHSSRTSRLQ